LAVPRNDQRQMVRFDYSDVSVHSSSPVAGLEDAGFRTDVLINFRTLMARGLESQHEEKLNDGSGIDHLSEEFFATVDPLIGQAFGICA